MTGWLYSTAVSLCVGSAVWLGTKTYLASKQAKADMDADPRRKDNSISFFHTKGFLFLLGACGAMVFGLVHMNAVIIVCSGFAILCGIRLWRRMRLYYLKKVEDQLDNFLVGLADSLTAVPNLVEAITTLHPHTQSPLKDEIAVVLAEVKLGRSIEDALAAMAHRLDIPALNAAVQASLLSHRVGGDLPSTLKRIAEATREMSRLEGVLKSKTAEGMTQAWVIGAIPPALTLYLDWSNPSWLEPMWTTPAGWFMFALAAVFEIVAIALIQRITAVEL